MNRVVRCTIQMDLIEGHHFNPLDDEVSDEQAIQWAVFSFLDMIGIKEEDDNIGIMDYVQTKIVEEVS